MGAKTHLTFRCERQELSSILNQELPEKLPDGCNGIRVLQDI